MSKHGKRRRDDEGLDFGGDIEEKEDVPEEVDLSEAPEPEPEEDEPLNEFLDTDMNNIVEDDDEVRFSGKVSIDDLPVCPCCSACWTIREGTLISPGCGCAIHPPCPKCDRCEAHCQGHRK